MNNTKVICNVNVYVLMDFVGTILVYVNSCFPKLKVNLGVLKYEDEQGQW